MLRSQDSVSVLIDFERVDRMGLPLECESLWNLSLEFHPLCELPDQVQESARPQKSERFMVKEESAASVGTRPWTPEGRSLTLSIASGGLARLPACLMASGPY
ncbi:hypothetical protein AVEN_122561-1 [Araneus ventricosus]|uniref:Uncharacterized protein n=1 Tax=Araneus ventricosus TaxID=182803 RepID=A0A4Y2ISS2_ARAVE|nr:hypothetical protein AVEN_122561-1 [Araneus ventricosus]